MAQADFDLFPTIKSQRFDPINPVHTLHVHNNATLQVVQRERLGPNVTRCVVSVSIVTSVTTPPDIVHVVVSRDISSLHASKVSG